MIDYIVEANSFEHDMLYMMHHEDYTWDVAISGIGKELGRIDGRPVFISILIDTINGKNILFWFITSTVADYDMVDNWIMDTYPGIISSDASNFSQILSMLEIDLI